MVKKQRHLLTTNKIEALHQRTLRIVPKTKLMRRTYLQCCKTVVLYDALGIKKTTELQANSLGYSFGASANHQLEQMDGKERYNKAREKTKKAIRARFLAKKARVHLKSLNKLSIVNPSSVVTDHTYC